MPWGFIFVREGEVVAKHPTQLYEAGCYFILFALLMWMYWKKNAEERPWLITGVFFIGIFLPRFVIEFIKNDQTATDTSIHETIGLNIGQLLSVPFVILGVILVIVAMCRQRQQWTFPNRFPDPNKPYKPILPKSRQDA